MNVQIRLLENVSFRGEYLHVTFFFQNEEPVRAVPTVQGADGLAQPTHDLLNTEAVVLVLSKQMKGNQSAFLEMQAVGDALSILFKIDFSRNQWFR